MRAAAPRCDLLEKIVKGHGQHFAPSRSEPPVKSGKRCGVFST
jgi:hypothetical protein